MAQFSHLHTHSHYSLLNALPKIPDLIKAAKDDGMKALALTDSGNLYGAIEFYKECLKAEIKPIIGLDAYVAIRSRHDKQAGIDNRRSRLVLLAENLEGYNNLIKLVTAANLEGFYYKPRVDHELIKKYQAGLICLIPSFSGEIALALKNSDTEKATSLTTFYKSVFPSDRLYLEISHHPEIEGHEDLMKKLVAFASEQKIQLLAAHDVYYINKGDKKARDTLLLVSNTGDWSERSGIKNDLEDFSFITSKQAEKLFKNQPEALENIGRIVARCDLKLELGKWVFPKFEIPDQSSYDEELRQVVQSGYGHRNIKPTEEIQTRVDYELDIIKQKRFAPYFLIVADLLRHARENNILSNIRGSVSGSMVTFLAGITNINPLEYEIPFERFLNPDRPSPPDIDMDFADSRRDEMIAYVRKRYGADHVAQIGTFGTMMARGSVRDVARALGFPYSKGDEIAKLIPFGSQGFPMSISKAMEETPDLTKLYKQDADTKTIIDMAKKIEGCARHIGVHAAGVVISPTELTDFTPLQFDPKGENKIITQYDMYSIEEAGLLKFDFLGLKNLTIISDAIARIKKINNVDIDYDQIPLDDTKTFEMLARGETADLFQLNGDGMTRFLKDLKPSTVHDINAMVALYRPGPLQFIPQFIERKHNQKLIKYLDPALEPILKKTYGILVYQDDLLMMAHKLAGYSWGEVDKFRKAVGKKIPEEMAKQKERFIKGCVEHSKWPEAKAKEIWKWIEPFAAYGFNKAHSVSYGRIAYITAYLKANFPTEYLSAVLSAESGETEKVGETITECKRMGIEVLPPSANESYSQFTVVKKIKPEDPDRIRFGLVTIKNFGQGIATAIIEERKKNGHYKSLANFLERVRDRNLNKKSLEALIKAGALDDFGERGSMLANSESLLLHNKESSETPDSQDSLFGSAGENSVSELRLEKAPEATMSDRLAWEKELLGLYISGHPLDKYKTVLDKRDINILKVKSEPKEGSIVVLGGLIEEVKPIATKKGAPMAFVRLADLTDKIECVIFPKILEEFKSLIIQDKCIAVKGKVSIRNGEVSLLVEKIKELRG